MVKILYVEHGGKQHPLDIPSGWSAMEGAIKNGVRGVVAECGGSAICGTCHVYVDPTWVGKLPKQSEDELATLDAVAAERKPNSRLSCQIEVLPALDGLILQIPERQQ